MYIDHDKIKIEILNDIISDSSTTEIVVASPKRIGCHAIIYWIANQANMISCIINDVETNHEHPFISKQKHHLRIVNNIVSLFNYTKWYIYNYEDCKLKKIFRENYSGPKTKTKKEILVLRDPFNNFASRLKCDYCWGWGDRTEENKKHYQDVWIEYAKEYLGETNYMKYKVNVNFNNWFVDVDYRKDLCKQIGLIFSDGGKNYVPDHGMGSSFNNTDYNGKASEMDVLNRYKEFIDDEYFRSSFSDELLEYTFKIYDPNDFDLSWL